MSEVPAEEKQTSLNWWRAHPLSPLTQMWVIFAVIAWNVGISLYQEWDNDEGDFIARVGESLWQIIAESSFFFKLAIPLFLLAVVLIYWSWFVTFFAVGSDAVYRRSGLLTKKYRTVNLERIQSIDIVRPFLPRLLGLSQVTVDVADGTDSAFKIEYLKHSVANEFRSSLLRKVREAKSGGALEVGAQTDTVSDPATTRAADSSAEETESAATTDERQLTRLPVGRLVLSILLNLKIWLILLFTVVSVGTLVWASDNIWGAIVGNLAIVLMAVTTAWNEFNQGFNFRISHSSEGLKIRKGLTNSTTQSVPTGRIQALEIKQPLLWKRLGWFTVTMNVAGYGLELKEESVHRSNLMLVATEEEIKKVLPLVVAQRWNAQSEVETFPRVFSGTIADDGFTPAPASSRWFDPLTYRRNGYLLTPTFLLIRRGLLTRRLTVVPHDCIQSVELSCGPLQRKTGLATLKLHSVEGQITPQAKNIDRDNAKKLLALY